jgi:hypothetical protein
MGKEIIMIHQRSTISRPGLWALPLLLLVSLMGQAQSVSLVRDDFMQVSLQGFDGDRQNGYAWAMQWFNGNLLVGTDRAQSCTNAAQDHDQNSANPYPPTDPAISCPPLISELPPLLQAEIWSWSPVTGAWTRVFQSPLNVLVPGYKTYTAPDTGFRGMGVFTEADGTQALYVSGASASALWPKVPGARLLRSTDGVNFNPVPQDPGTFLGTLHNQSFRDMVTYNGNFYIVAAAGFIDGAAGSSWQLLESSNPEQGDNAFQVIPPPTPGMQVSEIAVYNGYLYVGYRNEQTGFEVYYTNGQPPYTYTQVITNGGYNPYPNHEILHMLEYNGSLYMGGDGVRNNHPFDIGGAELYRINPDNSWDLIVGPPRTTPNGEVTPLSGLGLGFGWNLNNQFWRLADYNGCLYVGTSDESTVLRFNPQYASFVAPELGADLWSSCDGVHFSAIDINGFEDEYNYGYRTFSVTPYGLFVGTVNPYFGLQVWLGVPNASSMTPRQP